MNFPNVSRVCFPAVQDKCKELILSSIDCSAVFYNNICLYNFFMFFCSKLHRNNNIKNISQRNIDIINGYLKRYNKQSNIIVYIPNEIKLLIIFYYQSICYICKSITILCKCNQCKAYICYEHSVPNFKLDIIEYTCTFCSAYNRYVDNWDDEEDISISD